MSTKVNYHPDAERTVELEVLSENADKTLNLGVISEGKQILVVSQCKLEESPTIGAATLQDEQPKEAKKK